MIKISIEENGPNISAERQSDRLPKLRVEMSEQAAV